MSLQRSTPAVRALLLSLLCILGSACAGATVLPDELGQALDRQTQAFVDVDGFAPLEFEQGFWDQRYYTPERFPGMAESAASLPDAALRPIARAILLMEAQEGVLPHVRYQLEYLRAPSPGDGLPLEIAHLQLTRFNLGPGLHRQAAAAYGAENVAPAAAFGIGPHLRWRLVLQPAMGQLADVSAASRRMLDEAEAGTADCLGTPCLSGDPAWGPEDGWRVLPQPPEPEAVGSSPAATAAAALARALQGEDAYGEPQDAVGGRPQLILVISQGIDGQDPPLAAVGQVPNAMDDAIEQIWLRRIASATAVDWERRLVYRPGRN